MIISTEPTHRARKEWQDIDKGLMRILNALDEIRPHTGTSFFCWLKSEKGYYKFREEVRAIR